VQSYDSWALHTTSQIYTPMKFESDTCIVYELWSGQDLERKEVGLKEGRTDKAATICSPSPFGSNNTSCFH
jgi:hypothetical protein